MRRNLTGLTILILATLVLMFGAGCASTAPTLGATGATLEQVGKDWLAANRLLVEACRPSGPKLDKETCATARKVGEKFKAAYPLAMTLYEAGVNANDAQIAGGAKAVIRSLAADGASLAIKVGLSFVKVD